MKVVQTFWCGGKANPLDYSYGWKDAKYHLLGWILSVHQLRKFYNRVELYTDKAGYDLLIGKLQLPYTDVHIVLDDLNSYDPDLWALPKIRTYSLQKDPFLHVDGDVFIWDRLPERVTSSPLIAQNEESETQYYRNMLSAILPGLNYIPKILQPYFKNEKNMRMFNMGITGGQQHAFFREYASKAFEFVDSNQETLKTISRFNFNIFFEQLLFHALANEKHMEVGCLFKGITEDKSYVGFGDFDKVPTEKSYLHLLGSYKRNQSICRKLEIEVLLHYPEYYFRLKEILPSYFAGIPEKKSLIQFINKPLEEQSNIVFSSFKARDISEKKQTTPEMLIQRDLFNRLITSSPASIKDPSIIFYCFSGYRHYHVTQKEEIIPTGINDAYSVNTLKDVDVIEIPEHDGGISEYIMDDIDAIILKELEVPGTFSELILRAQNYLEETEETNEEFLLVFTQLIHQRLQKLLTHRKISIKINCITPVEVEKPLIE